MEEKCENTVSDDIQTRDGADDMHGADPDCLLYDLQAGCFDQPEGEGASDLSELHDDEQ